jgi:hypothetical protein
MNSLSAAEREVVCTVADDEDAWHVFTDSARLTKKKLLAVASRWNVRPERLGEGWQFTLPLSAVRFVGPTKVSGGSLLALQLHQGRPILAPERPIKSGISAGPQGEVAADAS